MDKKLKEILKLDPRYKGFILCDEPVKIDDLISGGLHIPLVQIHSTQIIYLDKDNPSDASIVGFCGAFEWNEGKIIPLDGDSYSRDMEVIGYHFFDYEDDNGIPHVGCDLLVGEDW